MDDAIKKVRQLAASTLVRKEQLQEQLAALEAELQQRQTDRDRAISAEAEELALELSQIVRDLDERVDLKRGEVAEADASYREIIGELRSVQDAAKQHERLVQRAPVDSALAADPFALTAEDAALENVRRHIDQLSTEADLNDELRPPKREPAKEDAEAKAKAQLEELKAKKKAGKPKKTM